MIGPMTGKDGRGRRGTVTGAAPPGDKARDTASPRAFGQSPVGRGGIAAGARVLTLDGALPVEYLAPGDRVITRRGARVLRSVTAHRLTGEACRVMAGALGFDRPEGAVWLAPETGILIRDWRARALWGRDSVVVPVARLADGDHVARLCVTDLPVFTLGCDGPEILRVEGMEIAAAPELVAG